LLVLSLDVAGGALDADLVAGAFALLDRLGPRWRFLPIVQARNAIGALAAGGESDRLPGGAPSPAPGPTAPEILRRAAAGEIQTLLLHRVDELVTHPQRALIEKALEATPNVIAIDVFPSWITERASIVLPGALFFETRGSMASIDGTLLPLTAGNQPPGDAQEDWRIVSALIERLGGPAFDSIDEVFELMRAEWRDAPQIRLRDLQLEGPGPESPQRPQPVIRKKTRPNYKLRFSHRPTEAPSAPPPATRASGELRLLWQTAIQGDDHLGSRSDEFAELRPEFAIELSPADAERLGLSAGDRVRVSGCERAASVKIDASLPAGVAFGSSNALGLRLPAEVVGLPSFTLTRAKEGE
jgi:anaerobic selenocysteine-containing dehydrogenase